MHQSFFVSISRHTVRYLHLGVTGQRGWTSYSWSAGGVGRPTHLGERSMQYIRRFRALTHAVLFIGAIGACGFGDARLMRAYAGTYVYEHEATEGKTTSRVRRVLTLNPDYTWTQASRTELNGRVASSWSDSGSFSFNRKLIVVLSTTDGVTKFRPVGDTLWTDRSEEEKTERLISGEKVTLARFFFVRHR